MSTQGRGTGFDHQSKDELCCPHCGNSDWRVAYQTWETQDVRIWEDNNIDYTGNTKHHESGHNEEIWCNHCDWMAPLENEDYVAAVARYQPTEDEALATWGVLP